MSVSQSVSQSVNQSASQSAGQPVSRSAGQPVSRSAGQPAVAKRYSHGKFDVDFLYISMNNEKLL